VRCSQCLHEQGSQIWLPSLGWVPRIKKASVVLLFTAVFAVFPAWTQVDALLVDPSLIGRELRVFARDALGVEELQVRYNLNLPSIAISMNRFDALYQVSPALVLLTSSFSRLIVSPLLDVRFVY